MIYHRSIPETPDNFNSWLKAWHELVRSGILHFTTPKGRGWYLMFDDCQIAIQYKLREIELMSVTIRADCQGNDTADFETVLTGLIAAIDTKWPQNQMSYDEAYRRIEAGENKTKVKQEFQRGNPNVTDESFYAAMYYRRRKKDKI